MKTLNIYVVVNANTDLSGFKKVVESMSGLKVQYEADIEVAVNTITQQRFDLLVTDKNLAREESKKLHRLVDLLHPDAAWVDFVMADEMYINYKLNGLLAKWIDANGERKVNFTDNPHF